MSIKTYHSLHIDKSKVDKSTQSVISQCCKDYNSILHFAFSMIVRMKQHPELYASAPSLYNLVKDKYGNVSPYLRNTAVQRAEGIISSLLSNQKHYIDNEKTIIGNIANKIKSTQKQLDKFTAIKELLILGKCIPNLVYLPNAQVWRYVGFGKNRHMIVYANIYLYECQHITPSIKRLKQKLRLLNFKKNKHQAKLDRLTAKNFATPYIPSVQFGGKVNRSSKKRHKQYVMKRTNSFTCGGRSDAPFGNWMLLFDCKCGDLTIALGKDKPYGVLHDVVFPYGNEEIKQYFAQHEQDVSINQQVTYRKAKLRNALKAQNQVPAFTQEELTAVEASPVAFSIKDHGDYYIVTCSCHVKPKPLVTYGTQNGVIGVDSNSGFLSIASVDATGNARHFCDIPYATKHMKSGQRLSMIRQSAVALVDIAAKENKPIVIENVSVKSSKKIADYNSNPRKNKSISDFASAEVISAIQSRAEKMGVEVYKVDPSYTSFIGAMKYIRAYHRPIHQCAALVIGRRAVYPNRQESLPAVCRSYGTWVNLFRDFGRKHA